MYLASYFDYQYIKYYSILIHYGTGKYLKVVIPRALTEFKHKTSFTFVSHWLLYEHMRCMHEKWLQYKLVMHTDLL